MDAAASSTPATSIRAAAAASSHSRTIEAIEDACDRCLAGLAGARADLAVAFFSAHHLDAARAIAHTATTRLQPRCLVGASVESVIAGEQELEGTPGVAVFAASLPGVRISPFRLENAPHSRPGDGAVHAGLAAATGMLSGAYRGSILLADPFSISMNMLLPALAAARPRAGPAEGRAQPRPPIIGGMASASRRAGGNALLLGRDVLHAGAVGVSLGGPVRLDALVSQGCRPFGPVFIVTGAKAQMVRTLSGRPALQALHEAIESLDERSRPLLQRGLFLGLAADEYRERFGRGDFLVRNVVGADQDSGMLAVADLVRVGQTVQFHLRDAATASEDLGLLLDREQLFAPPAGALLFTCNGRGSRFFGRPHHDAAAIARAFSRGLAGEEKAKAGVRIAAPSGDTDPGAGSIPLAGCFAAGEIGPVGDGVFLHGHTACAAILRAAE
jgi:small ligand-binding sensory domain FIST